MSRLQEGKMLISIKIQWRSRSSWFLLNECRCCLLHQTCGLDKSDSTTARTLLPEANITVLYSSLCNIVSSWFKWWNNTVVPQLFKIPRWEVGHPDLKVGDICLLHQVKGKLGFEGYKYCHVDSIVDSRDNKVCTVVVKYYNYPSKKAKLATVDVRSLSLIPNLRNWIWHLILN